MAHQTSPNLAATGEKKIKCPECGKHSLSAFVEGIVVHLQHYNHAVERRQTHHIFITWKQLADLQESSFGSVSEIIS